MKEAPWRELLLPRRRTWEGPAPNVNVGVGCFQITFAGSSIAAEASIAGGASVAEAALALVSIDSAAVAAVDTSGVLIS